MAHILHIPKLFPSTVSITIRTNHLWLHKNSKTTLSTLYINTFTTFPADHNYTTILDASEGTYCIIVISFNTHMFPIYPTTWFATQQYKGRFDDKYKHTISSMYPEKEIYKSMITSLRDHTFA